MLHHRMKYEHDQIKDRHNQIRSNLNAKNAQSVDTLFI